MSAGVALREAEFCGHLRVFAEEAEFPYERPELSKSFLTGGSPEPPYLYSSETLSELDIELELGDTVTRVDPASRTLLTSRGEEVAYESLLLATGAQCRRLEVPSGDLTGIHYLRNLSDARALRFDLASIHDLVIIGAGVIGMEVAAAATIRGILVTVIETAPRVLGRVLPSALAFEVANIHRRNNVRILTRTVPTAFLGVEGRVRGVVTNNGEMVQADAVVVGVGITPRSELATFARLAVHDGILVDGYFRASAPGIYAVGDAARVHHVRYGEALRSESWQPAAEQGRVAASNILGHKVLYRAIPWMWSDQYDTSIQVTGLVSSATDFVRCGSLDERGGIVYFGVRDGKLVSAAGMSRGAGVGKLIRACQRVLDQGSVVSSVLLERFGSSKEAASELLALTNT
jgi:3-phenylpropionate/trans-cinnamate dioxygenase ferredoxin reductase subunit